MTNSHTGARDHVIVGEGESARHPLAGARDGVRSAFADQPTVEMPSGGHLPALGLGTWQLEGDGCRRIVAEALALGVRHIDTAQMYGNEADVGAGIAQSDTSRDEIFLTTKVDNNHHEPGPLVESVERSLERLGTDHVDLLLVHWPVEFNRVGATMSALAQVQAAGLAHHIGASNFTIEQLDQSADFAALEVLQCECHPFFQQTELRNWCTQHGWAFTAYSPLARGGVLSDDVLRAIADKHGVSPAAIAVAWLLDQPQVATIPKTGDIEHLRDNWAALDVEFDQHDLDRISELDEGRRLVDPDSAPW